MPRRLCRAREEAGFIQFPRDPRATIRPRAQSKTDFSTATQKFLKEKPYRTQGFLTSARQTITRQNVFSLYVRCFFLLFLFLFVFWPLLFLRFALSFLLYTLNVFIFSFFHFLEIFAFFVFSFSCSSFLCRPFSFHVFDFFFVFKN